MNIIFADLNGAIQNILPIIPEKVHISTGENNETFQTLNGFVRLTGAKTLKEISWDSFLPVNKSYPFQTFGSDLDGWNYVNFFENIHDNNIPCRLIVTTSKKRLPTQRTVINTLVSVDSFEYETDKVGDINYSLKLTEFPSDKWSFLTTSLKALQQFQNLNIQSAARKKLIENGLL